jgi:hypothetical protein
MRILARLASVLAFDTPRGSTEKTSEACFSFKTGEYDTKKNVFFVHNVFFVLQKSLLLRKIMPCHGEKRRPRLSPPIESPIVGKIKITGYELIG